MHEAEEAVFFVLQILPKHIHKIIHALAIADFKVELRICIEHIVQGVIARLRIYFVVFEFGPRTRQVLAEYARVFERLLLAEIILIKLIAIFEICALFEWLTSLVIVEFL